MYSFEQMMKQREEDQKDMQQVQAAQDGSFAHNIPAVFVGGKYNGMVVDHDTLMKMGNGQFTLRWSQLCGLCAHTRHQRESLNGIIIAAVILLIEWVKGR